MKPESFFPEMNCQQCREECERLLDESLTEEQRSEIEARISAHLETCPDCASEFAFVQNLRLTLPQMQSLTVEPPTFLRANVRAALVEEFGTQRQSKPRFAIPLWTRSMWAGGLVVAFGFLLLSRQISPFSVEIPNTENRSSDHIAQVAPPADEETAPMARQERTFAKAQPNKKSGSPEILPERTPLPAPKVFVSPSKPTQNEIPAIELPEVKIAPIPMEKDSPKPKQGGGTTSPTTNKPKAAPQAPVSAPPASSADATPQSMRQRTNDGNRTANSGLSKAAPANNEQAFALNDNNTADAMAGTMQAAPVVPQAIQESAANNWQNGKVTLALVPEKIQGFGGGVGATANGADARIEAVPQPSRAMAAKAPAVDRNTTNSAAAENRNYGMQNSKVARGGGERPQAFTAPAAPITPRRTEDLTATNVATAIKAPTLIPRKLTLQSEFAVSGARLLQNGKSIWEGDLSANQPVEIEFMAPVTTSEKNSFVLEQIGADGQSNRKSLTLGD